ncbi:hyccin-like isoform X1 [Asterias amurensis]|uniref:hyccin-like isoform X1 n=1 Tax=Asterias amurensis TaxID=7602 RepID=UPI003AB28C5D
MAARLVQEWLTEYKSICRSDIPSFSRKNKENIQLIKAIFDVLQPPQSNVNLQEPVCGQLYEFYRSGDFELKRFCLQFIPAVIWNFLFGLQIHQNCSRAGSLLLGIYNMEAVEADGVSRVESFIVPTLAKPSIYHEPVSQLALTENVLSYQQSDHHLITRSPSSQYDELTIQNRFDVLTYVLSEYNADIGFLSPVSHAFFSQICSRLALCGFSEVQEQGNLKSAERDHQRKLNLNTHKTPRIPLDSLFLLEMLTGIYFVMFNGQATAGMLAVDDIHFRASYENYADVLLVTNAIKHSLDTNPSGRPNDGPVGINVAITPPSPVVKRSAITNASFKIRRQKETTITVTIESVEKRHETAHHLHLIETSGTDTVATTRHTGMAVNPVDVTVLDQSGSKTVDSVEMEEVTVSMKETESKQTNKDNKRLHQSSNLSYHSEGSKISPASHSRELVPSNNRPSSSSSGESIETNL